MSISEHLQSLRSVNGFRAAAVLAYTGDLLEIETADPTVDLALVAATFNDIFRAAHAASEDIGLGATKETVIKTPNGQIVMACSGVESKLHIHLFAVLAADGNQALLRMRMDKIIPLIQDELI